MGKTCVIVGCKARKTNPEVSLHLVPKNPQRRKDWLEAIENANGFKSPKKELFVCSQHCPPQAFQVPQTALRTLVPNAVPSIFEGPPIPKESEVVCDAGDNAIEINVEHGQCEECLRKDEIIAGLKERVAKWKKEALENRKFKELVEELDPLG